MIANKKNIDFYDISNHNFSMKTQEINSNDIIDFKIII
jgi:hypothetical protein